MTHDLQLCEARDGLAVWRVAPEVMACSALTSITQVQATHSY